MKSFSRSKLPHAIYEYHGSVVIGIGLSRTEGKVISTVEQNILVFGPRMPRITESTYTEDLGIQVMMDSNIKRIGFLSLQFWGK